MQNKASRGTCESFFADGGDLVVRKIKFPERGVAEGAGEDDCDLVLLEHQSPQFGQVVMAARHVVVDLVVNWKGKELLCTGLVY